MLWTDNLFPTSPSGRSYRFVLGLDLGIKANRKRVKGIIDKLEAWGDLHPVIMKVHREDKEGYTARPLQEGLGL